MKVTAGLSRPLISTNRMTRMRATLKYQRQPVRTRSALALVVSTSVRPETSSAGMPAAMRLASFLPRNTATRTQAIRPAIQAGMMPTHSSLPDTS